MYIIFFQLFILCRSIADYGEGNGTPLQYSCLENPMDGGAWWATVHGVAKSRTRLSDFTFTFHFPALEKEMATHSSVLAWRIPGMGEPRGLLSMGSHRVGHDWSNLAAAGKMIIRLGLPRKVPIFIYHLSVLIKNSSPFTSQNCLSLDNKLCVNLGWWDPVFSCGYAQRNGKWLWPSHFVDLMFLMCKMKLYVTTDYHVIFQLEYFNQYWYFVNLTVIHRLCILFCKITSKVLPTCQCSWGTFWEEMSL